MSEAVEDVPARTRAAVAYLDSLPNFERDTAGAGQGYGLERMRLLLEVLEHPDTAMRVVHIAGTKGKGSTAAMVAAMLRASGRRAGLYTSPHLIDFRERIVVDAVPISDEALGRLVLERVRPAAERVAATLGMAPLHFEQELALALLYFKEMGVEDAVLEVGLGGRLDATNAVADPDVSVLTPIGYDHMQILGYRLEEIAAEKSAIIRPGGRVICAPQPPAALEVVRERCRAQGATLTLAGVAGGEGDAPAWEATVLQSTLRGLRLDLRGPEVSYQGLWVALAGRHQATNASVAVAALHTLWAASQPPGESGVSRLPPRAGIVEGLRQVVWPGRLQVVGERPLVILDGAHNKESAEALAEALRELLPPAAPITLVLNILRDKDLPAVVGPLVGLGPGGHPHAVLVTGSSHARAASPERVAAAVASAGGPTAEVVADPRGVLARAREVTPADGIVLVTGSLRIVGDILAGLVHPG